jgi:hypothetical protein
MGMRCLHVSNNLESVSGSGGDVRFGSKADICNAKRHVRFTPEADMCGALARVCFGPKADIFSTFQKPS